MAKALSLLIAFITYIVHYQFTYAAIILNEIFPNPVDENDEFIELYNSGELPVDLNNFQVADLSKTYIITEATISAKNWYVLPKSLTKIALNNDTETVTLRDSHNQIIDSFSYDGTDEGWSYSRISDGNSWQGKTQVSLGTANIAPAPPSPSPTSNNSPSPSPPPASPIPVNPTVLPSQTIPPSPKVTKINEIILLTKSTPKPSLTSTSSPDIAGEKTIDWQLIIMLLLTGSGLLITPTIIIIRQWRKNGMLGCR